MKLGFRMNEIYFNNRPLMNEDYEESRKYFIYEGCTAVGINSLTSGAILAGFVSYMGASDEINGIIGAIPAATGIIQLFSSLVFEKLENRKLLVVFSSFVFRFLLSAMFLIPMLASDKITRLTILVIVYVIVYLTSSFINPPASNWLVDLTPAKIRGAYFARRDAISLGFLTILTVFMGMVLDKFEELHYEYGGFLVIGAIVFAMTLLDAFYLINIREPKENRKPVTVRVKDAILKPIQNKKYRKVIYLYLLWNIGLQIGAPYFSIYLVTGLELSYTYIMVMGIVSSVVRVFAAKFWGRMADSRSWAFTTKVSIAILAIGHFGWILMDQQTVWLVYPILSILGGIAWSGINLSLFSIQFVMAPEEGRTMYLGTGAAFGGVAGFLSTLIGSVIINQSKSLSFQMAGIELCNMHIVFVLSGIILFFTALYVHFKIPAPGIATASIE